MIGKYLLAVICFSLAQVHGLDLQDSINNALEKVDAMYQQGNLRIEEAVAEVENTTNLMRAIPDPLIAKSQNAMDIALNNLRTTAQATEEIAMELDSHPSVFRCITNAERSAVNHITALTNKYKTDLERTEQVKLNNINTYAVPLSGYPGSLTVKYTRVVGQLKTCKTLTCVRNAVNSCTVWVNKLLSYIDRILSQVSTACQNFENDTVILTDNTEIPVASTEAVGLRQIQGCLRE